MKNGVRMRQVAPYDSFSILRPCWAVCAVVGRGVEWGWGRTQVPLDGYLSGVRERRGQV